MPNNFFTKRIDGCVVAKLAEYYNHDTRGMFEFRIRFRSQMERCESRLTSVVCLVLQLEARKKTGEKLFLYPDGIHRWHIRLVAYSSNLRGILLARETVRSCLS